MSEDRPLKRPAWLTPRVIAAVVTGVGIGISSGAVSLLLWGNPGSASGNAARPVAPQGQMDAVMAPDRADRAAAAAGSLTPSAPPVHIDVPSIRVSSDLTRLKMQDDGALEVPKDPAQAGWWSESVAPGDPGPAIIIGHVDSLRGPAVFYRLSELHPGDPVVIARADGTSLTYTVDALRQYPKNDFPSDLVYGSTETPTLRLLTCGGNFDRRLGHYEDNLVVFAHLPAVQPPATQAPPAATPKTVATRAGVPVKPAPPQPPAATPTVTVRMAVRAR